MKSAFAFVIAFLGSFPVLYAQDDLFGIEKKEPQKGFVIAVNGGFDIPAADMADRFGLSYRVGPSVFYKTESNWIFGLKADFIFGNQIREDSLLINLKDEDDAYIGYEGFRSNLKIFERGYLVGVMAGKLINTSRRSSDNGILLLTSAGFIQHKILVYTHKSGYLPQLEGDYKKGYDRLANGLFLEQFAGYSYFHPDGFFNFYIGAQVTAGFTQGRRELLFDVRRPGNEKRFDVLFGIRGGWYIPIFRKKSEEYFFE